MPPFAGPGLVARVGPVRRCQQVLEGPRPVSPGTGGGVGPPPSLNPPRRGAAAAAAGGTGRVTVHGGVGPEGPLSAWMWWPGGYSAWYGGGGPWW